MISAMRSSIDIQMRGEHYHHPLPPPKGFAQQIRSCPCQTVGAVSHRAFFVFQEERAVRHRAYSQTESANEHLLCKAPPKTGGGSTYASAEPSPILGGGSGW